jgi:hypothetical protein
MSDPIQFQVGALVRLSSGVVGEWTGRVATFGADWLLEIECDGAKAWWNVDFLRPAYEADAVGGA